LKIRVAGTQMAVQTDILINTKKILVAIDRAAEAGADILLTPEGNSLGQSDY
jgi:predicted amidohydrolase